MSKKSATGNRPGFRIVLLAVAVAAGFSIAQTSCSGDRAGTTDRDRFTGAWRLVSLEQPGPDGRVHRVDCSGLLVYTSDGHMSVQVMDADPKAGGSAYSHGGYEASYGTFDVDPATQTFVFHVEGALVRTLAGKSLHRAYALRGNQLTVQSTNPDEHWKVVWERY